MNHIISYFFLTALAAWMAWTTAFAQTSQTTLVQSAAGGTAQNSSYTLIATIGQAVEGNVTSGAQHILYSGFIYAIGEEADRILEITPRPPTEPIVNESFTVTAQIEPSDYVAQALLLYRRGGDNDYQTQTMIFQENHYAATLQGQEVTDQGFDYYIKATALNGDLYQAPSVALSPQVRVPARGAVNSKTQPGGTDQTAYRLVSFPLDINDKRPQVVLDEFDGYDSRTWRFYELLSDQSYQEYLAISEIKSGIGYWLITKDGTITLDTGAGKTFVINDAKEIDLHAKWNFIGTPFNFPLSKEKLKLVVGGAEKAFELRSFKGSWNDPVASRVSQCEPFEGYAVYCDSTQAGKLIIDPTAPTPGLAKSVLSEKDEKRYEWGFHLRAQCQDAKDIDNYLGVKANAAVGWDEFDVVEPPVIGEYVSLCFKQAGTSVPFCIDVRPVPDTGESWSFEVKTNITDAVTLVFEELEGIPAEYEVRLIDINNNTTQDVQKQPVYEFVPHSPGKSNQFHLLVGQSEFIDENVKTLIKVPDHHMLAQNYPNPFNPQTTITYGLAEEGNVTLKIYSLLGEEVKILVRDEWKKIGYHQAVWDGRDKSGVKVASGIYIYHLQVGTTKIVKKMVLAK